MICQILLRLALILTPLTAISIITAIVILEDMRRKD